MDVAADEARRFVYPHLDLSVLAVPHQALAGGDRPALRPEGRESGTACSCCTARWKEYFLRTEAPRSTAGHSLAWQSSARRSGATSRWAITTCSTRSPPKAWYAGALDYVSPNIWGELALEVRQRCPGQGLAAGGSGRRRREADAAASRPSHSRSRADPGRGTQRGLGQCADRGAAARDRRRHRRPDRATPGLSTFPATSPGSWTTPPSGRSRTRRCTSIWICAVRKCSASSAWGRPDAGRPCLSWSRRTSVAGRFPPSSTVRPSCGWDRI